MRAGFVFQAVPQVQQYSSRVVLGRVLCVIISASCQRVRHTLLRGACSARRVFARPSAVALCTSKRRTEACTHSQYWRSRSCPLYVNLLGTGSMAGPFARAGTVIKARPATRGGSRPVMASDHPHVQCACGDPHRRKVIQSCRESER